MIYKYKAFRGREKIKGNIKADNLKEAKEKLKRGTQAHKDRRKYRVFQFF